MLPPVDIGYIAETLRMYTAELAEALDDRGEESDSDSDPQVLQAALSDLFGHLGRLDDAVSDRLALGGLGGFAPPVSADIRTLGDHGIDLLARLTGLAGVLLSPDKARAIGELALPFACWIARRGGEIGYLEPVVEGAAHLANRLLRPSDLAQLYGLLTEVVEAVDLRLLQDPTSADRRHPWRILLLNRAIVATRSHQPELMEEAFEAIVDYLPDETPRFFYEGMEQMDALDYPSRVRDLMLRFYNQYCGQRVLH